MIIDSLPLFVGKPEFLNGFFLFLNYIGKWYVLLIIVSLLLLRYKEKLPLFWITYAFIIGINFILKNMVMRTRPDYALISSNGYSFPSGHAAAVFACLPFLFRYYKRLKWLWILIAILIVYSRLYLGIHYLSDIIVGVLLGYLISKLALNFNQKL